MPSVHEFADYRAYLSAWLSTRPRGGRSALARAAGCQLTYLSRVLAERANLSLEQAEALSHFLQHSPEEADVFLLHVQLARAGTPRLREHFRAKLAEQARRRLSLKERFKVPTEIDPEQKAVYYSRWRYAAAHVLLSIPELQSRGALAARLGVPLAEAAAIVDFLVSVGLAVERRGRVEMGVARLHLGGDSPLVSKHHLNWRLRAMHAIEARAQEPEGLHYTSVATVSREDAVRIRAQLTDAMERFNAVVRDSPAEAGYGLCLDFFET